MNGTDENWSKAAGYITNMVYNTDRPMSDVIGPILSLNGYLHIKNDIDEDYRMSAYLEPFSNDVWIHILISVLTSSIVAWLIELISKISTRKMLPLAFTPAFRPLETMCNQCRQLKSRSKTENHSTNYNISFIDGSKLPGNPSSRLAWLSVQISASVLVPAYSAAVISFVTVSRPKLPFTDLESFLQVGTYKTSGIINTFTHTFFEYSMDQVVKDISAKLLINDTPVHNYEAMKWICRDNFKYAYVAYNNDLYFVPQNCKILKIPKPIFSVFTGSQLSLFSPYTGVYKRK